MTGAPIYFDEPPRICPHCMTNNWRQIDHPMYDPARPGKTQDLDMPRVLVRSYTETVCGTCHPDPRSRKVYVDGVDPDNQRSPF